MKTNIQKETLYGILYTVYQGTVDGIRLNKKFFFSKQSCNTQAHVYCRDTRRRTKNERHRLPARSFTKRHGWYIGTVTYNKTVHVQYSAVQMAVSPVYAVRYKYTFLYTYALFEPIARGVYFNS